MGRLSVPRDDLQQFIARRSETRWRLWQFGLEVNHSPQYGSLLDQLVGQIEELGASQHRPGNGGIQHHRGLRTLADEAREGSAQPGPGWRTAIPCERSVAVFVGYGPEALLGLHTGRFSERKRLRFDVGGMLVNDVPQAETIVETKA